MCENYEVCLQVALLDYIRHGPDVQDNARFSNPVICKSLDSLNSEHALE